MPSSNLMSKENSARKMKETYLSLPKSRYVRLKSEISWVISPFFSDLPCIPFLWNAKMLSGKHTAKGRKDHFQINADRMTKCGIKKRTYQYFQW